MNLSPVLTDILKAISQTAGKLGMVGYLCLVTSAIFSSFGILYFRHRFEAAAHHDCATQMECFLNILHFGFPESNLNFFGADSSDGAAHLFFDVMFFIWVGVSRAL